MPSAAIFDAILERAWRRIPPKANAEASTCAVLARKLLAQLAAGLAPSVSNAMPGTPVPMLGLALYISGGAEGALGLTLAKYVSDSDSSLSRNRVYTEATALLLVSLSLVKQCQVNGNGEVADTGYQVAHTAKT